MATNDFMLMESQQSVVFPGLSNKAALYLHILFWNYCPPYALISNLFKLLEECWTYKNVECEYSTLICDQLLNIHECRDNTLIWRLMCVSLFVSSYAVSDSRPPPPQPRNSLHLLLAQPPVFIGWPGEVTMRTAVERPLRRVPGAAFQWH